MSAEMGPQAGTSAQPDPDFDYWEFVACCQCRLPFVNDGASQPTMPFWLTDCGHVVCNSHLNADQSCPNCQATGIELMPLQKDLPAPMSDWFCHIPYRLDALAQATRFQLEALAASARYYKQRCTQYRGICERLKNEASAAKHLRKEVEALRNENEQLRAGRNLPIQPRHDVMNMNGKRPRVDNSIGSLSSPRSIHTPLGPTRITLPPVQDPPQLLNGAKTRATDSMRPPGSSQFRDQYAYNPPPTQQNPNMSAAHQQPTNLNYSRGMPPPPTPMHSRQIRHSNGPVSDNGVVQGSSRLRSVQANGASHIYPQQIQGQATTSFMDPITTRSATHQSVSQTHGSAGPSHMTASMSKTGHTANSGNNHRRFIPPAPGGPSGPARQHFVPSTPSRASMNSSAGYGNVADQQGHSRRFVPSKAGNGMASGESGALMPIQQQRHRNGFLPASRAGYT